MLAFVPPILFVVLYLWFAHYLVERKHGVKEPIRALWAVFFIGVLGVIVAGIVEVLCIPSKYNGTHHGLPVSLGLALAMLGVGAIEECIKFFPTAWYVYRKPFFNQHADGVIYFALAGVGFGFVEDMLYMLDGGAAVGFTRLIMGPFFHSATTGLVGFYLAKVKIDKRPLWEVAVALLVAIVLHGTYDFGLSSNNGPFILLSVIITLCVNVMVFKLYWAAIHRDQKDGLQAVPSEPQLVPAPITTISSPSLAPSLGPQEAPSQPPIPLSGASPMPPVTAQAEPQTLHQV